MHSPKLSIITVNLNNAAGLRKTIESVVNQTFTDYEYIIIDGGSTDGSVDVIKEYEDKITYWVSEPDKGIYNGMNKGIKVAKGEYCQFLNSGDWLIDENVLGEVFADFPDADIVYGNLMTEKGCYEYPNKLTLATFFSGSLPHPSSFIKTQLFKIYGLYNENNKIVSDWEFYIISLIINNCSYIHIEKIISSFESGGISSKIELRQEQLIEWNNILQRLFPMMYDDYIELFEIRKKLKFYENSRLIQKVKKIQESKLYRKLRNVPNQNS